MTIQEFQEYLVKNTVRDPEHIRYVDVSPLSLPFDEVKFLGKGIFNTVYKVRVEDRWWVVKEGAYDLKFPVFKSIYLPLPRRLFNRVYNLFGLNIMPSHKGAIEQLQEYIVLAKYFGYFTSEDDEGITGFEPEMLQMQRDVRDQLRRSVVDEDEFAEIILKSVKTFKNYHKIRNLILDDNLLYYHYLPKEHLGISKTSSKKGPLSVFSRKLENHYIIQDCVEGETLGSVSDRELFKSDTALKRMVVFLLLAISMTYYDNKLIDSRPEGIISGDWFGKTGNIIINLEDGDVRFVDTRWLNYLDGNLLQKGIVVADLIIDALSKNLSKYVEAIK